MRNSYGKFTSQRLRGVASRSCSSIERNLGKSNRLKKALMHDPFKQSQQSHLTEKPLHPKAINPLRLSHPRPIGKLHENYDKITSELSQKTSENHFISSSGRHFNQIGKIGLSASNPGNPIPVISTRLHSSQTGQDSFLKGNQLISKDFVTYGLGGFGQRPQSGSYIINIELDQTRETNKDSSKVQKHAFQQGRGKSREEQQKSRNRSSRSRGKSVSKSATRSVNKSVKKPEGLEIKTQPPEQKIKEIYSKEIDYITMEIMMMQQILDNIKDNLLLHLNREMQAASQTVEKGLKLRKKGGNLQLEVKTVALNCEKIDEIKKELQQVFGGYQFRVVSRVDGDLLQSSNNGQDTPELLGGVQSYNITPRAIDEIQHGTGSHVNPRGKSCRSLQGINIQPHHMKKSNKEQYSEHKFEDFSKNFEKSPTEISDPLISTSKLTNDNHHSTSIIRTDRDADFGASIIPDPSDSNFNCFLESELEKITKAFLQDTPLKESEKKVEKPKATKVESREHSRQSQVSRRLTKNPSTNLESKKKRTASSNTHHSKGSKGNAYYKEKFEELYNKGKSQGNSSSTKPDKALKRDHRSGSFNDKPDRHAILNRLTQKTASQQNQADFKPLFKED